MRWRSFFDRPVPDEVKRYLRTAQSSFKRQGLKGLINAGRYLLERERRPDVVKSRPAGAQIEPTKVCNLRCVMCSNPYMPSEKKGHMPLERFIHTLDQMPFLSYLVLQGLGEIFCHPRIMDFFREARKRRIYFGFSTNGLLLDDRAARELLDIGVGWVNFSVDTHDAARYAQIRGRDVFDRVRENIGHFARLAHGKRSGPRIELRAVYMRENMEDLPNLIRFAHDLGVYNLTAKEATSRKIVSDSASRASFYKEERERIAAVGHEVRELAQRLGINLVWQTFQEFDPRRCYLPWASCYITFDGRRCYS
jgi:MoaA/NifB/PqqE/SkfB family radical SAM enzyme